MDFRSDPQDDEPEGEEDDVIDYGVGSACAITEYSPAFMKTNEYKAIQRAIKQRGKLGF